MSDTHSLLAKPVDDARVSDRALGYVSASLRMEMYQLVLTAFHAAKISKATLAKRMNKRPEQISRLLSGPGNWTIDTAAQLLFAIDGSLGKMEQRWPDAVRNSNFQPMSTPYLQSAPVTGSPGSGSGEYHARRADEYAL